MKIRQRLARLSKMSPTAIPRVVAGRLASSARAATERLVYRPNGPRHSPPSRSIRLPGLLHAGVNSPEFGDRFREHFPHDAELLIGAADGVVQRRLRVLSADVIDLDGFRRRDDLRAYPGESEISPRAIAQASLVPWHFDVKSGVCWSPRRFFSDIVWGAPGVDVKVPWELSRCQYFITLGQAYRLTNDEKYAAAFSEQIEDWIRANPPKYGVNWACAMDVALRAMSWVFTWEFFHDSPSVSTFVKEHLPGSLWEHGRHLRRHLEWAGDSSTNHYLSNLLGLGVLGRALGERAWWDFACDEMKHQIGAQTYKDGFDYESSTSYHRLVLEIFLTFSLFATADHVRGMESRSASLVNALGKEFHDRLYAMGEFLLRLSDAEGRVPLVGDNDSGRVFLLGSHADNEMAYLTDLMALFFGDERLRLRRNASSDGGWLFGLDAVEAIEPLGTPASAISPLAGGPSGLATLRGADDVLLFVAQPGGTRGVGNHAHNDKLSLCLNVGRDVFLSDPGTYLYTSAPEERNAFRCTGAHSTVQVDNAEQNRFLPGRLFTLPDDARARIIESRDYRVTGVHGGYRRLADPVTHKRSIERIASPLSWIIEDELEGREEHGLRWRFVVGPQISAVANGPAARLMGIDGEIEISVHPAMLRFQVETARLAPAYGATISTPMLSISWRGKLPFRATFTIVWRPRRAGGR